MDLRRRRPKNENAAGFYILEDNVSLSRIEEVILNPPLDNVTTFGDVCFFLGDKETYLPNLKLYPGPNTWVVSCSFGRQYGRVKVQNRNSNTYSIIPDITPDLWFYIPHSFFLSPNDALNVIGEFAELEFKCVESNKSNADSVLDNWTSDWEELLEEYTIDMEQDIRMDIPFEMATVDHSQS